jgi:hypothetical protein
MQHVALDFARVPTRMHTAADVALLEEVVYDLTTAAGERGDDVDRARDGGRDDGLLVGGYADAAGSSSSGWVDVSVLAAKLDRVRPAWRRQRLAEFVNFRYGGAGPPLCA